MRSATAFLPPSMITFMNLDSSTLPNFGSGRISRLGTSRRRGIFYLYLASVGAISGTARAIRTPTYSTRARHVRCGPLRCAGPRHAAGAAPENGERAYLAFGRLAPYLERAC